MKRILSQGPRLAVAQRTGPTMEVGSMRCQALSLDIQGSWRMPGSRGERECIFHERVRANRGNPLVEEVQWWRSRVLASRRMCPNAIDDFRLSQMGWTGILEGGASA